MAIKKATVAEVALECGVSKMTVSRVLNNDAKVKAETREKVLKAIKSLNYVPNLSARNLRGTRPSLIALMCDNPTSGYLNKLLIGSMGQCKKSGLHLILEVADEGDAAAAEELTDFVNKPDLAGVILAPPICDYLKVIAVLRDAGVPYVRIAPDNCLESTPSVCLDDYTAAFEMTQYLIDLGHKNIGFIIGQPGQEASRMRYQGFLDASSEAGIKQSAEYIKQGYFTYRTGLECAEELLSLNEPPTAIFASNDDMAAAVVAVANAHKLDVPKDLSVVGFDDAEIASTIWPHLTTVKQPFELMAEAAINLLIGASDKNAPERIPLELIYRDSVAAPNR